MERQTDRHRAVYSHRMRGARPLPAVTRAAARRQLDVFRTRKRPFQIVMRRHLDVAPRRRGFEFENVQ